MRACFPLWPSRTRLLVCAQGALLGGLVGCGSSQAAPDLDAAASDASFYNCATEPRAVPAVPGLVSTSTAHLLKASLDMMTPGSVVKGSNTWQVRLADADDQPVAGATLKVTPYMPDHGHGTSLKVVVTDLGAGEYQLTPLYLYMGGYWEITLNVTNGGAASAADTLMFPICVPG